MNEFKTGAGLGREVCTSVLWVGPRVSDEALTRHSMSGRNNLGPTPAGFGSDLEKAR